ncbi:hypothetical protein BsWGS_13634 [Bradybaena similaris]
MALTSSACPAMLLRIIKPKRLTFALSATSSINSSRTICPNNPRLCQHGDDWLSNQPISACQTDYDTKLYDQKKEGCSNDVLGSPAVNCNFQKMSRHLKQLVIGAPCVISRFFPARSTPLAGYYNYCTASSLSSSNGRLSSTNSLTNNQLFHKNHEHNVLYRHQSQRKFSSFSPAKLILELSPTSLQPYLRLIRFDKPIGTWLLYWPCTWSIALAATPGCLPDFKMLALFGAGAFFMRSAGCIINDMWDKDFDGRVARTRTRPLAAGDITQFQALVCLGIQLSCALAILLQLNTYSIILGAASMAIVVTYPAFKRFTYWPQIMLGLTLNWGVLLAWSTLKGSVELPCLALYLSCATQTVIYDTIYAHQDKTDDMIIGIKSTAILFGDNTKYWLSAFATAMAGGMAYTGYLCHMPWLYYLTIGVTATKIGQQLYTIDINNPDECGDAFRAHHYLGALVFAGIVVSNLMRSEKRLESRPDGSAAGQLQLLQQQEMTEK